MVGVQVVFDMAIDEGSFPGPIGNVEGSFGELWLGPQGLLALLETGLGLAGKFVSSLERVYALSRLLEERDGFWRASFETDALATSERLLSDRDLLVQYGWQGEFLGPRLAEVWKATRGAPLGVADRLREVADGLAFRRVDIASIHLYRKRETLPPVWATVIRSLERQGASVRVMRLPKTQVKGDLEAARSSGFVPAGDGSLALLRPYGQLGAAEEIAASLAQLESLDGVVIIGGDSTLDEALERHGLPRLGLQAAPAASHALVQLVLETAFAPMDPASLHRLLCLDPGPVPRSVASRLIRAITSIPGRFGPEWDTQLSGALERIPEDNRAKMAERLNALLLPVVGRDEELPIDELEKRLKVLCTWAGGRLSDTPALAAIVTHSQRILQLAEHSEKNALGLVELKRLCASTSDGGGRRPGQAGLRGVASPAGILGPARVMIWWDFSRATMKRPKNLRLNETEQRALREIGLRSPNFADAMTQEAELWQRPLRLATEALILVSPEVDESGDANYPHPLWDELTSAMKEPHLAEQLVCTKLRLPAAAARERCSLAALPVAEDETEVRSKIAIRDTESPSSLESLLGCSLKWTLQHHGRLYAGISDGPGDPSPLLYGTISHYLLAEVFKEGALDGETAAQRAEALVDSMLTRMCEALALPRYQENQGLVRRAVIQSARQLGQIMSQSGAAVRGVELDVKGEFAGLTVSGRADMILDNPDVVVDLKWSKSTYRKKLESGTAFQLAAYAHSSARDGALPSVAYFSLRDQTMMGEPDSPFPDALQPGTTTVAETWRLALEKLEQRKDQLAKGELVAPGAMGDDIESAITSEGLRMSPNCVYCSFGVLCGRGSGQ